MSVISEITADLGKVRDRLSSLAEQAENSVLVQHVLDTVGMLSPEAEKIAVNLLKDLAALGPQPPAAPEQPSPEPMPPL